MAKQLAFALALFAIPSFAANTPAPSASTLKVEIQKKRAHSFQPLLNDWEKRYGSKAVPALAHLAQDASLSDSERYVALMGVARLGGRKASPFLTPFLKNSSWMIRSAALRALGALGDSASGSAITPLIKDPALVVRLEAIEAIQKLKPAGAVTALIAAIEDPRNYHSGKPQWIPQKALETIANLPDAKSAIPSLQRLKTHKSEEIRKHSQIALARLLAAR